MSGASGNGYETAGLTFTVDSSPIVAATGAFNDFSDASDKLSQKQESLTQSTQRFIAIAREVGDSTALLRRQFTDTSQSLDGLLSQLDNARTKLDGTQASFQRLGDAKSAVDALGASFGATSAGIEAFSQQSQLLGLNASQTALALQRITEALNNQTLAGQQVRTQIQGLGVDLAGLTANSAGDVLAQVVQRLRAAQDGIGKFQTETQVLGITDPATLNNLNLPSYIPTEQRRQIGYQQQADRQIAATTSVISGNERQYGLDTSAYSDLSSQYNLGGPFNSSPFTGLSSAQRAQLQNITGLSGLSSQGDRLTALQYLADHPDSDLANSARTLSSRATNYFDTSYVGGAYRHLFDGTYSSNDADISDRYNRDSFSAQGIFGRIGAFGSEQYNRVLNDFNLYTPQQGIGDARALDPITVFRNNTQVAATLAGFGDPSASTYQGLATQIRSLQANGAGAFSSAFGNAEGLQRYAQTLGGLTLAQGRAAIPGGNEIDQAQRQAYLLSIPPEQRGQAQALLEYYDKNVPGGASALYANGPPISPTDAINAAGTAGGAGFLSGQQSSAFQRLYSLNQGNSATAATQNFDKQILDQQSLTDAAIKGSAALDDARVRQEAYNKALGDGAQAAQLAADRASELSKAQKETANQLELGNKRFANDQQDGLLAALAAALSGGSNAAGYSFVNTNATIQNQFAALQRSGGADGLSYNAYSREQLRPLAAGVQQNGLEELLRSNVSLADAQSNLGISQIGGGDGSMQRGQQLIDQFSKGFGIMAAAGQPAVDALNQLVDAIARVQQKSAQAALEAKNYATANTNIQSAANDRYFASLPPSQVSVARQQLAIAQQPGNNPILAQHVPLQSDLSNLIDQQAASLGITDPGLLAIAKTIPRLEGATDNPSGFAADPQANLGITTGTLAGLPGTYDPSDKTSMVRAMLTVLQQNSKAYPGNPIAAGLAYNTGVAGAARFAASGDIDTTGLSGINQRYAVGLGAFDPATQLAIARGDTSGIGAAINSVPIAQSAATQYQISNLVAGAQPRSAIEPRLLSLLGSGQGGAASLLQAGVNTNVQNPLLGQAEADQRVADAQNSLAEQGARNISTTQQQIDTNNQLAQAYSAGSDAVTRANATIQAYNEFLAGTVKSTDEATRAAQLYTAAISKQNEAGSKSLFDQGQQRNIDAYSANLPIESDALRQQQVAQYTAYQNINNTYSDPTMQAQQKAAYDLNAQQRDLAQSAQTVNQAFNEMGQTIFQGFERGIETGESFKRTLGGVLDGVANIIAKITIEKPLENFFTNQVGGWFGNSLNGVASTGASNGLSGGGGLLSGIGSALGGIGNFLGLGGGAAAAGAGAAADGTLQLLPSFFARGGAFDSIGVIPNSVFSVPSIGQVRMHASGSVVNSPTGFVDGSGGANMMGEAGPEGILPLKVMPDGNLGVQSAGSGLQSVTVHAPINIQGQMTGGPNGGMDPSTMKAIQRQMEMAARSAVNSEIVKQQRPGGKIYGTIPN